MQMKNFTRITLGFLCVSCMPIYTHADTVFNGVHDEDIYISESGVIKNYGTLNGTIHTNGYTVRIENYGEINSEFDVANAALVTQVVNDETGLHRIYKLGGHNIVVNTTDEIDMAEFVNFISGAADVSANGACFVVGANVPDNNVEIHVGNDTSFYVTTIPNDLSQPLVRNIWRDNTTFVDQRGIDPMYIVEPRWVGNDLYINLSRQTDYSIVMDNDLGEYLDELRVIDADDKLLYALDRAPDRASMKRILSESAHTNPIKLMDVSRSINTFFDSMAIDDIRFGFVARPLYIWGDDYSFVGGAGNITGKIANHTIGTAGIVGGMLRYDGDYDKYSGALYGGNLGVQYMDSDFYLRGYATASYSKFNDANVFDGAHMVRDVNGIGAMGVVDFGLVFAIGQEMKLVPFVGARADYASVMNDSNVDMNLRGGLNFHVDTDADGNLYKIGARLLGQSDGAIYAGIYTDMISTADGVGGGLALGALRDDMGMSYKLELNIKFEF